MHLYASRPHYLDHMLPIWDALERPERPMVARGLLDYPPARERGAVAVYGGRGPTLVAGWPDLYRARGLGYGPFVYMQHGAGQSYHGDPSSAGSHSYAGAPDHDDVALFIVPGPDPARRWRERYPDAKVVECGNTKPLPAREGERGRVVAVTFHWPCAIIPEAGSAWREYRGALLDLAKRYQVLGHWHPRWGDTLRRWYADHGIEPVASLEEVARRADLLVADNTSAIFEFADTGRPVLLMDSARYRRHVSHGLRFWDAAHVGLHVNDPTRLCESVHMALLDPPGVRWGRQHALSMVYAPGGTRAAAEAIAAM